MTTPILRIEAHPLRLRLKTTIRHAAATRSEGESVWVRVTRNGQEGYGEGCPRIYVTGETVEGSLSWIQDTFGGEAAFASLEDLRQWVEDHEEEIDVHPSAWCAVELAVLDLLSRERDWTVERLLGLDDSRRWGRYTAVLGDDETWQYTSLVDQYLVRGLTDFKIKVSGNLGRDLEKLQVLETLAAYHRVRPLRMRLDANNVWWGRCDEAVAHVRALGPGRVLAMEEPVAPKAVGEIDRFIQATGVAVILDESLCTRRDLAAFAPLAGPLMANIKVSRAGGLLRALRMVDEVRQRGWPIVVGCHVGETSLLTRAAMVLACAAGESLMAQEGAFGDYLAAREPASPMLKFGSGGLLDLRSSYALKTVSGLKVVPPENWRTGFGMACRLPPVPGGGAPEILTLGMPDGYRIHYRSWGPGEGTDAVVIYHGGMSHSGWQAPLAEHLGRLDPALAVVAPDRRGCGLNDRRGDLGSVPLAIEDVVRHVEFLKTRYERVHLAGWCQGAQYATVAAARLGRTLSSLILLTPGFFWNERFRSVLSITEKVVLDMISQFDLKPDRDMACIPIPMEATDFTLVDEWLDFIEQDDLKTTAVTLKSVAIMDEVQELSWFAMLQNRLPVLAILAEEDRIVDNRKVLSFIGPLFEGANGNRLVFLPCGHALQFERPAETAEAIRGFVRRKASGG